MILSGFNCWAVVVGWLTVVIVVVALVPEVVMLYLDLFSAWREARRELPAA